VFSFVYSTRDITNIFILLTVNLCTASLCQSVIPYTLDMTFQKCSLVFLLVNIIIVCIILQCRSNVICCIIVMLTIDANLFPASFYSTNETHRLLQDVVQVDPTSLPELPWSDSS